MNARAVSTIARVVLITLVACGGGVTPTITLADQSSPVTVSTSSRIVGISAGINHSLALTSSGNVLAWGSDTYGELGNGNQVNFQGLPIMVENANGIVAIAAGLHLSLALKFDGTVQSWGLNNSGQLGDDTGVNQKSPVSVLLGAMTIRVP
jgi:alpha-tubulin suppressor-like RCC1 family protein